VTLYAHHAAGTVDAIGQPPRLAYDGTRWWDLRERDPDTLAALGWLPVVEAPRPADTPTDTHEAAYAADGASVVQSWTPRPWTADELAAQAEAAAWEAQQAADRAALDALATTASAAHADGEPWVQPTGAHDAYAKGARVSFEGSDYESLIDGNTWSPTAYPAGWLKL